MCAHSTLHLHRQLRKWHDALTDKVITLMGTDLVRYKDRWAAGVKDMRDVFARLEAEGYTRDSQQVCVCMAVCVCAFRALFLFCFTGRQKR